MNLINLIKGLLKNEKKLDITKLPSQGLFYKDDFEIKIKKANIEDIVNYEFEFVKEIAPIILKIKKVVYNNTIFSDGYVFDDLKSIDIIYIFLEIVKWTNNSEINLSYFDEINKSEKTIQFNSKYFNYYNTENVMKYYDNKEKCFIIDNYKYSFPSIGVENGLTDYLISKYNEPDVEKYNDYFYEFTYFLGNKRSLSIEETENLVQIFNFDIEESEITKIKSIIKKFEPMQKYSLIDCGNEIDLNSKIDLSNIWK